jgi:hypothetical protein
MSRRSRSPVYFLRITAQHTPNLESSARVIAMNRRERAGERAKSIALASRFRSVDATEDLRHRVGLATPVCQEALVLLKSFPLPKLSST